VHIDPAGRNHQPRGIDLAPSRSLLPTDPSDPTVRDCNVTGESRFAGPIDDGAAANDNFVHGTRSCD
jgi:hypothetical protein